MNTAILSRGRASAAIVRARPPQLRGRAANDARESSAGFDAGTAAPQRASRRAACASGWIFRSASRVGARSVPTSSSRARGSSCLSTAASGTAVPSTASRRAPTRLLEREDRDQPGARPRADRRARRGRMDRHTRVGARAGRSQPPPSRESLEAQRSERQRRGSQRRPQHRRDRVGQPGRYGVADLAVLSDSRPLEPEPDREAL